MQKGHFNQPSLIPELQNLSEPFDKKAVDDKFKLNTIYD